MPTQIKLEIEPESYEKVYCQLMMLYDIANKASLAIEKIHNVSLAQLGLFFVGFGMGLLVSLLVIMFGIS